MRISRWPSTSRTLSPFDLYGSFPRKAPFLGLTGPDLEFIHWEKTFTPEGLLKTISDNCLIS